MSIQRIETMPGFSYVAWVIVAVFVLLTLNLTQKLAIAANEFHTASTTYETY